MSTKNESRPSQDPFILQDLSRKVMAMVTLLLCVVFIWRAVALYAANGQQWPLLDPGWAGSVLGLVAIQILAAIVTRAVLAGLLARSGRTQHPEDERDQVIELRGSQFSHTTMSFGFLGILAAVWLGAPVMLGFNILVFGFFLSGIVYYVAQLAFQHRGW